MPPVRVTPGRLLVFTVTVKLAATPAGPIRNPPLPPVTRTKFVVPSPRSSVRFVNPARTTDAPPCDVT